MPKRGIEKIMGDQLLVAVQDKTFERLQPRKSLVRQIINMDKEEQISNSREKILDDMQLVECKDTYMSEIEYNKKYGKWFCSNTGTFSNLWKYFLLANMIVVAIIVPCRVAFETKPKFYSVYFELYMSSVFLLDMLITFNTPISFSKKEIRKNYSRTEIAKSYLKTWFLVDLYGFFPLAYLRSISEYEQGSHDGFSNLMTMNFERMPRLYKMMLVPQIMRVRKLKGYLEIFMNN